MRRIILDRIFQIGCREFMTMCNMNHNDWMTTGLRTSIPWSTMCYTADQDNEPCTDYVIWFDGQFLRIDIYFMIIMELDNSLSQSLNHP